MSKEKTLKGYYQAYADWLDNGAPEFEPFNRGLGLCHNVDFYCGDEYLQFVGDLREEQDALFEDAELDEIYPFGGRETFYEEMETDTSYLNKERVAWVRSHLEEKK